MRHMALDLGDRRIGVALSDTLGMLARPLLVFERTSRVADCEFLKALVSKHGVEIVVAGLPVNMDGTEGPQAAWVRDYCAELSQCLGLPICLWDERLTTEEAIDILRAQGKQPTKETLDAVAAAVILQGYLDAQR